MSKGKHQTKKKGNKLLNVLIIICIIVFIASGVILVKELSKYWEADKINSDLKDILSEPPTSQEIELTPPDSNQQFAKLYAVNNDFIGWIQIPNTHVDYPVVHTDNNDYYLENNFYKEPNKLGTVFVDSRAVISPGKTSDHLVLYGHSAQNGSFFADARKYKTVEYYQQHAFIDFDTLYDNSDWIVVSAFMIDAREDAKNPFWYHDYIDFTDESLYNEFINQITQRNYFVNNIDLQYGDKFITLSTCDYDFDDSRFAVTARKLRDGETKESFDLQDISLNQNRVMPERWG